MRGGEGAGRGGGSLRARIQPGTGLYPPAASQGGRGSVWVGGESLPRCVLGESGHGAKRSKDAASKTHQPPASLRSFPWRSVCTPWAAHPRCSHTASCPHCLTEINNSVIDHECGLASQSTAALWSLLLALSCWYLSKKPHPPWSELGLSCPR